MVALSYSGKLNDIFDRVYVHGVAVVPRAELLLWEGQTKVTKKLWRDLAEAWAKRCQDEWGFEIKEIPPLLRAWNPEMATYILLWGGTYDDDGKFEPYFKAISEVDEAKENELDDKG